ncbi:MAG: hypothetical protein IJ225_02180 [Solobacterium sp.]|nr:hypothetical protein [Solobacterium sp.]
MADKKELPLALIELFQTETDQNHVFSATEIREKLNARYGLTLERRTLYSNIELLRKYGYKISEWNSESGGYYLEERPLESSDIAILIQEVLSSSTIAKSKRKQLIEALLSELSAHEQKMFFPSAYELSEEREPSNLNIIRDCSQAIVACQEVSLRVSPPSFGSTDETDVLYGEPRKILYVEHHPVLMITSQGRIQYLRIDRIHAVEPTGVTFDPTLEVNPACLPVNRYGLYEGPWKNVLLRCNTELLEEIKDLFGTHLKAIEETESYFTIEVSLPEPGIEALHSRYKGQMEVVTSDIENEPA